MPSIPFVLERRGDTDRAMDLYSRLLEERVIFLLGEVNEESANLVVAQLMFLHHQDPKADIHFYINSPGGSVTDGMGVFDVMRYVSCDVATYCIGMAASMGATLLAAGTKGKRFALPHAEVMIHQVLGGAKGPATDIEIRTMHLLRTKESMNRLLCNMTGQPLERVQKDTDRDYWMTAQEAKEYGLVDHVIDRIPSGHLGNRARG
ncbi:MAG: ATP-dependent Clp protease proteolytic subunit [Planctomycetota bacterium]|nr:ATP-dependent Clp protease proteolytic subunit [Planctomycetota bacterium]